MSARGMIRRALRKLSMDPVRRCRVFREAGCAHVDGFLCDFPKCSIRHDYVRTEPTNHDAQNAGERGQ